MQNVWEQLDDEVDYRDQYESQLLERLPNRFRSLLKFCPSDVEASRSGLCRSAEIGEEAMAVGRVCEEV